RAELHGPKRPRGRFGAVRGRFREQRELLDAARTLPDAGASAVGTRIAATDDHDPLAPGIDEGLLIDGVAGEPAVLLGEKVHREMDAAQRTARDVELARGLRAARQTDRVEVASQRVDGNVLADIDARSQDDAFRRELGEAAVQDGLLGLAAGAGVA